MYAVRTLECVGCGGEVRRRQPNYAKPRCIECSIERSVINAYQMRQRTGAFYQAWAAGMVKAAKRAEQEARIALEIERRG